MNHFGLFLFFGLSFIHLLTEFVFQPPAIWNWEKRSSWGIIAHCSIFGVLGIVFFFPFLNQGLMWWYIIFLSAIHFPFDHFKHSWLSEGKDSDAVLLLDQIAHFFWFALVSYYGSTELRAGWLNLGKVYHSFLFPLGLTVIVLILSYRQILKQWHGKYNCR